MQECRRATLIWWCGMMMMMMMMIVIPSSSTQQLSSSSSSWTNNTTVEGAEEAEMEKQQLGIETVTYEFGKTNYLQMVSLLRNKLAASTKTCGILTTPIIDPPKRPEYVHVKLIDSKTPKKTVIVGINVTNGYVLGYQDVYNNNIRANMLATEPDKVKVEPKTLFPQSTVSRTLSFTPNYGKIEKVAQKSRANIGLYFDKWEYDIEAVYGKKPAEGSEMSEARFVLRSAQFLSEAARFKFIAVAINSKAVESSEFKDDLIQYTISWDKISQAIHKAAANTKCGKIDPPLKVSKDQFTSVDTKLKQKMGLLLHKSTKGERIPIPTGIIILPTDDADDEE